MIAGPAHPPPEHPNSAAPRIRVPTGRARARAGPDGKAPDFTRHEGKNLSQTLSARNIEIAWPDLGITVTAELDDRNPALADALWESLPYRSLQGHALVAGSHLYHVAPIHSLLHLHASPRIPDRRDAPDGTVFCSALQHLGIEYGPLTEPMPASPVGRIRPEDLPALQEAGRAIQDAVYSTTRRRSRSWPRSARPGQGGGHRVPRLTPTDLDANSLIHDVHAETERIRLDEPTELAGLHQSFIPSGAGTHQTVLPTSSSSTARPARWSTPPTEASSGPASRTCRSSRCARSAPPERACGPDGTYPAGGAAPAAGGRVPHRRERPAPVPRRHPARAPTPARSARATRPPRLPGAGGPVARHTAWRPAAGDGRNAPTDVIAPYPAARPAFRSASAGRCRAPRGRRIRTADLAAALITSGDMTRGPTLVEVYEELLSACGVFMSSPPS